MTALDLAAVQIALDEGRRGEPYQDSRGIWTAGVGHNLTAAPLPEAVIDLLYQYDLLGAVAGAIGSTPLYAGLTPLRQSVLINMAFNLGGRGLGTFKHLFEALGRGDYVDAAQAMRDSDWARQVGARAMRLARQMEAGV